MQGSTKQLTLPGFVHFGSLASFDSARHMHGASGHVLDHARQSPSVRQALVPDDAGAGLAPAVALGLGVGLVVTLGVGLVVTLGVGLGVTLGGGVAGFSLQPNSRTDAATSPSLIEPSLLRPRPPVDAVTYFSGFVSHLLSSSHLISAWQSALPLHV
jgi:hypothetical protein